MKEERPINITVDRTTIRINRQFVNDLDILAIAVEVGSIKQGEENKYDVYKIVYNQQNDLKITNQMIDLYNPNMIPTEFFTVSNTPMTEGSDKF